LRHPIKRRAVRLEHAVASGSGRSARSFVIILIVQLAVVVLRPLLVDAFQVPEFILLSPFTTIATPASAFVGEFIASQQGLGYLMIQLRSSLDTPAMVVLWCC
jgi:hypothetical protein